MLFCVIIKAKYMNTRKAITLLNCIAKNLGGVSKLKAVKLLYFIEKNHFSKYGRFITGDNYIKMPLGPVPSRILNMIDNPKAVLQPDDYAYLKRHISFSDSNYRTMTSIKDPDIDLLSKSEITAIDDVLKKYGQMHAKKLVNISHKERAWERAAELEPLSVEDMVYDLPAERKEALLSRYYEDVAVDNCMACCA